MLSHASKVKGLLDDGNLGGAMMECDTVLDFMYHYDAERMIAEDTLSRKLTEVSWENIEYMYTNGDEMVNQNILDELVDHGINVFENLHSEIREYWRVLEKEITISHSGNRPYLICDGFVLINTPDNKIHIYSFVNPSKNFNLTWKNFKLEFIDIHEYDQQKVFEFISQVRGGEKDKIMYRARVKNSVKLDKGLINVISSLIFMQLRKDYSF
jgi:hypothetical protein